MKTNFTAVILFLLSSQLFAQFNTDFKTYQFKAEIDDPFTGRKQELYSVLDDQQGTHIVWIKDDKTTRSVMYTLFKNGSAQTSVVYDDPSQEQPKHPVIVLDNNNNPHMAWFVKRDESGSTANGNFAVMYGGDENGDGAFEVLQVSTNPTSPTANINTEYTDSWVNHMPTIFINESGGVEVAYFSDTYSSISFDKYLVIATKNGSSWSYNETFIIDDINVYSQDGPFMPDRKGANYFGVLRDISPYDIEYFWESNGNWDKVSITNNPSEGPEHPQVFTDSQGRGRLVFSTEPNNDFRTFFHYSLDGGSYSLEESFDVVWSNSNYSYAALDPTNDLMYYCYSGSYNGSSYDKVFVYFENGQKNELVIDDNGLEGYRTFNVNNGFVSFISADEGKDSIYVTTNFASGAQGNQAPVIANQSFNIDENSTNGSIVGVVVATDSEGDNLTFQILDGNTSNAFAINSNSGQLTVANSLVLDFETQPSFGLTVQASDGALASSATVIVNLNDVSEAEPPPTTSFNTDFKTYQFRAEIDDPFTGRKQELYSVLDDQQGTHIVWIKDDKTTRSVMYTLFKNGSAQTSVVYDDPSQEQPKHPVIVLDNNNNPHMAWFVKRDESGSTANGNFAVMYGGDENGDGVFEVMQVSTNPTSPTADIDTEYTDSWVNHMPTIFINESGGVEVAYFSDTYSSISFDKYLVIATKNGSSWSYNETFVIDDINVYSQDGPFMPDRKGANYFGVLRDISPDDIEYFWESNGSWDKVSITNNPSDDPDHPQVFTDSQGLGHLVFASENSSTDIKEIYHYTLSGGTSSLVASFQVDNWLGSNYTYAAMDPSNDELYYLFRGNGPGSVEDLTFVYFEDGQQKEIIINDEVEMGYRTLNVNNGFASFVTANESKDSIYVTTNFALGAQGNQAPVIANQSFNIDENSTNGSIVGVVVATDSEGDNLTFQILEGNTSNAFAINSTSGQLTVANENSLDFETNPEFILVVEVTDGSSNVSADITINLKDVDEEALPPALTLIGEFLKAGISPVDADISGNFVFMVENGFIDVLKVIDISEATSPIEVATFEISTDLDPNSIIVDSERLLIGGSGGDQSSLVIMNISDPTNPVLISQTLAIKRQDGGQAKELTGLRAIDGDILYAQAGSFNLVSVDISDPVNPLIIDGFGSNFTGVISNGIDNFRIADDKNAWMDNNDFRHVTLDGEGGFEVSSIQEISGELYDFEVLSNTTSAYALSADGSVPNVLFLGLTDNVVTETSQVAIQESIGTIEPKAIMKLHEEKNLLFIQNGMEFLVMDIIDKSNPKAIETHNGSIFLKRDETNLITYKESESKLLIYKIEGIQGPLEAKFKIETDVVETKLPVQFTDLSTGNPVSWSWEFEGGQPATSTEQNPSVIYEIEGTYDVTLTITDDQGNLNSVVKMDFIFAEEFLRAEFSVDNQQLITDNEIQFTDLSTGDPINWNWTFENGQPASSSDQNPVVVFVNPGSYEVTLTISLNNETATLTESFVIECKEILPEITVSGLGSDETTLTSSFEEGNQWIKDGEDIDGAIDQSFSPVVDGVYQVRVTVGECSGESEELDLVITSIDDSGMDRTIHIYPNPVKNEMSIEMHSTVEIERVLIYDLNGKAIRASDFPRTSFKGFTMDVSGIEEGVYFLLIEGNNKTIAIKFVKR